MCRGGKLVACFKMSAAGMIVRGQENVFHMHTHRNTLASNTVHDSKRWPQIGKPMRANFVDLLPQVAFCNRIITCQKSCLVSFDGSWYNLRDVRALVTGRQGIFIRLWTISWRPGYWSDVDLVGSRRRQLDHVLGGLSVTVVWLLSTINCHAPNEPVYFKAGVFKWP